MLVLIYGFILQSWILIVNFGIYMTLKKDFIILQ